MSYSTTILVQVTIFIGLPPGLWYFTPIKRFVPLVVVQIIVGILLWPSVLARYWPELHTILIPSDSLAALNAISSLAIVLFAFTMGVHFDGASIRGRGRAFAVISFGSIVTPTLIGVAMGWWMATSFPDAVGAKSTTAEFCLAIGICVGVTALPVLAAILREMRLLGDRVGQTALGLAVVSDAALWLLLALLLANLTRLSAMVCAAVITTALTMPFAKFALTRAKQLDVGLLVVQIAPEGET